MITKLAENLVLPSLEDVKKLPERERLKLMRTITEDIQKNVQEISKLTGSIKTLDELQNKLAPVSAMKKSTLGKKLLIPAAGLGLGLGGYAAYRHCKNK